MWRQSVSAVSGQNVYEWNVCLWKCALKFIRLPTMKYTVINRFVRKVSVNNCR